MSLDEGRGDIFLSQSIKSIDLDGHLAALGFGLVISISFISGRVIILEN